MSKVSYASNVWKLYTIQVFRWMMFYMPIFIPFMTEKGLTLFEILSLQAVFSIVVLSIEVPSGYFADRVGRKQSLFFGLSFHTIGLVTYVLGEAYIAFVVAEVLFGIGSAFNSGADEALLYDSLVEEKQTKSYAKKSGRLEFFALVSEGASSVPGGMLAAIALVVPFWFSIGTYSIAALLVLSLKEPPLHKAQRKEHMFGIFWETIVTNKSLKWIILYATVIGVGTRAAVWLFQPYFALAELDIFWYGILWATTLFVSAIAAWFVDEVDSSLSRHTFLGVLLVFLVTGYLLSGIVAPLIGLGTIMLIQIARGLAKPIINDEINVLTPSSRRATVLSVRSFVHNAVFAIIILVVGSAAESSVQNVFLYGSFVILVLGAISLFYALLNYRKTTSHL